MLLELRLLLGFPLVFEYESCKIVILLYKWNHVYSKGICVQILFISPVLDYNWGQMLSLLTSNRDHVEGCGIWVQDLGVDCAGGRDRASPPHARDFRHGYAVRMRG